MLTGPEIERQQKLGGIVIEPFDPKQVNPNSYNLRLGKKLLVYAKAFPLHLAWDRIYEAKSTLDRYPLDEDFAMALRGQQKRLAEYVMEPLDMRVEEKTVELEIPAEGLVLYPGILYLGHTEEYTETPNCVPRIDGRSSIGRLGLFVHITAAFGDVGYRGRWTLEVLGVHPIRVYAGTEICQISYSPVMGEIKPYVGKYQDAQSVLGSRLYRDAASEHD